jgi:DNA-binding MarR family transcriptional regulator
LPPKVTATRILAVLSDGKPRSSKEIRGEVGLSRDSVESALIRLWKKNRVLRTATPQMSRDKVFRGRAGKTSNLRQYHLYMLRPDKAKSVNHQGHMLVAYSKEFADRRGGVGGKSKSMIVFDYIKDNRERAFYSKELVEALKEKSIKPSDIMTNVRRFEKNGLVYVRGYRMHDKQTPFKDGYLFTWINSDKPREAAIEEAIRKTNVVLDSKSSMSPIIERIHLIRDQILEATKLRDLVSFEYIQSKLDCSPYEADGAIERAIQLYTDLKAVKLFGAYNYYYHTSMAEQDLKVAVTFKQNYVRQMKGRDNRIGHNWEACVEWFIDKFTLGAVFQTQNHRTNVMDPRRITLHLMKSIGGRKQNAEVDRVWSVTPGIFAQPITYVLECKWGLVKKRQVDDFLEVLRWSTEFGVNTSEGRSIKQGVVGVFAGSAFDPKESVKLKDETVISLASYAARINIQLLKASDFNEKMREKGVSKESTVQGVCRAAKNENEVREVLTAIWESPEKSSEIIAQVVGKNKEIYEFEKMLESGSERKVQA